MRPARPGPRPGRPSLTAATARRFLLAASAVWVVGVVLWALRLAGKLGPGPAPAESAAESAARIINTGIAGIAGNAGIAAGPAHPPAMSDRACITAQGGARHHEALEAEADAYRRLATQSAEGAVAVTYLFHMHKAGGHSLCALAFSNFMVTHLEHNCNVYASAYDGLPGWDESLADQAPFAALPLSGQLAAGHALYGLYLRDYRAAKAAAVVAGGRGRRAPWGVAWGALWGRAHAAGPPARLNPDEPRRGAIFMANEEYLPADFATSAARTGAVFVATARRPIDRALSHYRHEKAENRTSAATLGAWLALPGPSHHEKWSNVHVRRFCGAPCIGVASLGRRHLAAALAHLRSFHVVLVVDRLDEGMPLLRWRLGWTTVEGSMFRRGSLFSAGDVPGEMPRELREDPAAARALRDANGLDEEFLTAANAIMDCQITAMRRSAVDA